MNKLVLVGAGLMVAGFALGEVGLVRDGAPAGQIFIAPQVPGIETNDRVRTIARIYAEARATALRDLNYHLRKMSGVELPIVEVNDPAAVAAPAIVLGDLAVRLGAAPEKTSATKEGFRLLVKDGLILIGGESDLGTLYGIYEFLERLGCAWVMPGEIGEIIPRQRSIVFPATDESQSPDFSIRDPWYSGGSGITTAQEEQEFRIWKRRHKQQPHDETGTIVFPVVGGHAWDVLIAKYKKEFAADPSMLALVRKPDGTLAREGPQLESTSPQVLELFKTHIREIFRNNQWPNDKKASIAFGPADGMGYSVSPESLAAGSGRREPGAGGLDVTDLVILLGNNLLKELEKEFPNLYLHYYVYSSHGEYPMLYKPHPHIIPVIADINFSRYHSLADPQSKSRYYARGIFEQWAKLSAEQPTILFFRGYNWNLAEAILPYTKLKIWGEDIPYYKNIGVQGIFNQWFKGWSVTGPSDYLEVKLNWNSSLKWRDVLKDYCSKAFGKEAAPFLEEYYLNLVECQEQAGQEAGSFFAAPLIFNRDFVAKSKNLFDQALSAAGAEQNQKLVEYMRLPLGSLELFLDYRELIGKYDFAAALKKLEELDGLLNKYYEMESSLVAKQGFHYLKRLLKKPTENAAKYSSGEYRIAQRIPDRLKTMLDPYVMGAQTAFQMPEINDAHFLETATWSLSWDAQGLGGYRDGAVWYRIHFKLPDAYKGKPIGLFIGGVDDVVKVYLNGKYIGAGRGYCAPFVFDLSDGVKIGEDNLIAVQAERAFKTTELGLGGIIYPCFLFTGPRLEKAAPNPERLRRILPGGEIGEFIE